MNPPDGRTPVVVVTGFLGSGKTTLVNHLIKKEPESLIVVNEFGQVPVDHFLIEASSEKTVALPNGCLCCRLRGDLEETLVGAAMRRRRGEIAGFDRVIVETSGIADPGPVAQTLFADQALARDFKLGPIVTVVDAADSGGRHAAREVARAQIAAADVVVLSKVDRVENLDEVKREVEGLNRMAPHVAARYGSVDPGILLKEPQTNRIFSHPVSHSSDVNSFVLDFGRPVPKRLLERFLATLVELRGEDLLRVKGFVELADGEARWALVQGVRHVFDRLRPVAQGQPGLVFITNRIEQAEIESLWRAMSKLQRVEGGK